MSDNNKLRRGRPRKERSNVKSERVTFRMTKTQHKRFLAVLKYYKEKNPTIQITKSNVLNKMILDNFKRLPK